MLNNETYLSVPKPLTISRKEFKDGLRDLINNSMLPAFIINDVLKSIIFETEKIEQQQLNLDIENYKKRLMEIKNQKNNTSQSEEFKEGE